MSRDAPTDGNVLELADVHTYYGAIHALKGIRAAERLGRPFVDTDAIFERLH